MSTENFDDQAAEVAAERSSPNHCGFCDEAHQGGVCPDPDNPRKSPRDWAAYGDSVYDGLGNRVARTQTLTQDSRREHAERIVRAVNAHEDMLEALRLVAAFADRLGSADAQHAIREAIRKAEGEGA